MLGVEWYKREEVMQKDREFYRNGWEDPTNQTGGFLNATGFSPGQVTVNTSNLTLNQSVLPAYRPTQAAVNALFAPYGVTPPAGREPIRNLLPARWSAVLAQRI